VSQVVPYGQTDVDAIRNFVNAPTKRVTCRIAGYFSKKNCSEKRLAKRVIIFSLRYPLLDFEVSNVTGKRVKRLE
jgi:hypothetical protein